MIDHARVAGDGGTGPRGPLRAVVTERTAMNTAGVVGPSRPPITDLLGMAGGVSRVQAPLDMWGHQSRDDRAGSSERARGHDALRVAAIVLSVVALLLTSSALNWVASASAQEEPALLKAVIVVGPTHSLTNRFLGYGRAMADAAEAQGMEVKRLFHPYATKKRVKKHAQGANLFIYVGHGNGWPSPFPPFQEVTKNGLGLNPNSGERSTSNVKYSGADWLRENIAFSPNAVVILSHLSYASGNASSGMPIPSRATAVERIDNFANGFLAIGARVVFALGWQPGADVIDALNQENATMDRIFMTRYRTGVSPLNGWIGTNPGYYESVRTPGADIHIDPSSSAGYLRGLSGELDFSTGEWRGGEPPPPDTEAPVLSGLEIRPDAATVATGSAELPVFTPNGDGLSDNVVADLTLSEKAFVDVKIFKGENKGREWTRFHYRGDSTVVWDGRRDDGEYIGEGTFKITLRPRDRADNVGKRVSVEVIALASLKSPSVEPSLVHSADQDGLVDTARFKARLIRPGSVRWVVKDAAGAVVRRGIDGVDYEIGFVKWVWDGRNDAGQLLPAGEYTSRVRVTRPAGTYGHDVTVRLQPFRLRSPSDTLKRGQSMTVTIRSAEPLAGKARVRIKQSGVKSYPAKVKKVSRTKFKITVEARQSGRTGPLKVSVAGTDIEGGEQAQRFTLTVR
jgi:flagellar hook assembly protein FlgD